ncbi:hypothetical protein DIS24_g11410 [Lasiodiplodia hormozganensis]|uniref:Uncharacterized protein n=1 Tax=Lasiodiplodia hormozganensis TaxID=869390 RepID=A0AA40C1N9_9PEZI|nr:hypothetical protein DIS24_g11410 [Lasiodiplodia hormozganensis]
MDPEEQTAVAGQNSVATEVSSKKRKRPHFEKHTRIRNAAAMKFSVPVPEGEEDTRTMPKRKRKSGNLTTAQREARKAAKRAEEASEVGEAGGTGADEPGIGRAPVEVEEDDRLPWERKALPPISPTLSSSPIPIPWSSSPPRALAPSPMPTKSEQPDGPTRSVIAGENSLVIIQESSNKKEPNQT